MGVHILFDGIALRMIHKTGIIKRQHTANRPMCRPTYTTSVCIYVYDYVKDTRYTLPMFCKHIMSDSVCQ